MIKANIYWLAGLIIATIIVGGHINRSEQKESPDLTAASVLFSLFSDKTWGAKLGNLCSDEKKCISFCLNNRGQCENYCKVNSKNALCPKIFSPPSMKTSHNVSKNIKTTVKKCVSNPSPVFTAGFTESSRIIEISPIGHAFIDNPGSSARSYVTVNRSDGPKKLAPVYAPIDSTIHSIAYAKRNYGLLGTRPEYRLDFEISCEVSYVFDHLTLLSDEIKKYAPELAADSTKTNTYVAIPVQAGQLVAYTEGTLTAGGFDFMVWNKTNKENYINSSRWVYDHSKYGVCPYDYFVPELKDKYYSLLQKTRKDKPASCRTVSRDVPGTLSGGWFQGNSTDREGSRLSISTASTDMTDLVIVRNDQSTKIRDYTHPDIAKPEDVTVGKSVCYYDRDRTIYAYLKLLSDLEMGLALGNGACPSEFPKEYELWAR